MDDGGTHKVFLGLGSNLGQREAIIAQAIEMIGRRVGPVVRQSALIETDPWGFESEHKFLNGVVLVNTELTPREVLQATQQIERELGRKKRLSVHSSEDTEDSPSPRQYTDRPIDIDILLYDDLSVDEPDLKIPHPLMHERDFVMIPLNELINNN